MLHNHNHSLTHPVRNDAVQYVRGTRSPLKWRNRIHNSGIQRGISDGSKLLPDRRSHLDLCRVKLWTQRPDLRRRMVKSHHLLAGICFELMRCLFSLEVFLQTALRVISLHKSMRYSTKASETSSMFLGHFYNKKTRIHNFIGSSRINPIPYVFHSFLLILIMLNFEKKIVKLKCDNKVKRTWDRIYPRKERVGHGPSQMLPFRIVGGA